MRYFCTYFDINYLPRAMCLFDSLEEHISEFMVYVLCLDDECFNQLQELDRPYLVAMKLNLLEEKFTYLHEAKITRSRIEYYYTCGPVFIHHVLKTHTEIDVLTYVDADLYFFSDPTPLYEAFEGHSIGVVGHHLPKYRKPQHRSNKFGIYNVGWLNFRRDVNGLACLEWWRDRCLEWCYDRYEDGKFADQLYLNQWPELFDGFYEFIHPGANVAPWNVGDFCFSYCDGQIYVDEKPLIFFHFHGFKQVTRNVYNTNLGLTFKPSDPVLKQKVFLKYISALEIYSLKGKQTASVRVYQSNYRLIKSVLRIFLGILFRQYIIVSKNKS